MKTKNEDIIRKLFESKCSLSPEERAALNNYEYVNDTFHRQWEEMSEEAVDLVREEKILNGIMKKVRGRRFPFIKKSFYKYGMAAMIAVCMVLSALLLMKNSGEEIIYVVNTGYQSMDSVRLADGTKVMLNAGSRLTYPKEFSGEKREVQLSGQAFFEVTPDKTHPFVVKTQKMDVTVLGTSFEVFSYDGDEEGETVLRDRCGMPNVPNSLSKDAALELVRNERRIELAAEGHRYDDIRRYGLEYCREAMNGESTAPCGGFDPVKKEWQKYVVIDKVWGDRLLLMPIPTSAMDVNPLLKDDQNPGY